MAYNLLTGNPRMWTVRMTSAAADAEFLLKSKQPVVVSSMYMIYLQSPSGTATARVSY